MNKNSLLKIATFLCKLINGSFLLILLILTTVFIHFQIDRDFYEGWHAEKPTINKAIKFQKVIGEETLDSNVVYMTDWNTTSLYFNYIKFSGIFLLMYLSIQQFQKVLESVENFETFKTTNVLAFRRIGIYCLIISGLSWITLWDFDNYHVRRFSIEFDFLIIALLCFIFAEIFKEGNQLMEENQLTI
ncbi:DUF2975 domain-containing protein [Christiangramia sp. SM2212]|uniref:DUF2975 domain-containing protein n=1 Tax=Christiangramia sediminicola TaxID=3073267 RepID=A0ABU1EMD2_9FLAO|nr:DUF2975 domain-containing protein [Christiangramia sp. SM2212]MDR5589149.1 DUF2975 domain-containing protein [Christiangramia sp. SM2212]